MSDMAASAGTPNTSLTPSLVSRSAMVPSAARASRKTMPGTFAAIRW